jgi:hypothetical protein
MTRAQRFALTLGLVLALVAAPAAAAKPDKGPRDFDGKPGWGPPSFSHHHKPPGPPPAVCGPRRLDLCHQVIPPTPDPEPEPDPEPVPEPIPEPPITCATGPCLPPVIDLPDTALH